MKRKKIVLILLVIILYTAVFAQPKDFEGIAVYKVDVKSKTEGVSDRAWKNMLMLGDSMTIIIKQGNYRQATGSVDIYSVSKDEKVYFNFKGIDTLFYVDYSSDTSSLLNVLKSEEKKNIAGFDCKLITILTSASSYKYYYAPSLYMNPEYDKNNRISRYDVFAKETSSLYLSCIEENKSYTFSQTCSRLRPYGVDDKVFELPKLPRKMFSAESIVTPPKFPRAGGFDKYIQLNIDPSVSTKYIKIPKGEESATQTAIVLFMINENGRVINAQVINKNEVHPRVAEEALRVVSSSCVDACFCAWRKSDLLV